MHKLHYVKTYSPLTTHSSPKKAFTLAEVLITIAVIGVVAALTIGNLVTNYQKHQTVIGLKKVYNLFSEVLQRAEVDNGLIDTWRFSSTDDFSKKYLEPYFDGVTYIRDKTFNPAGGLIMGCGNANGCLRTCTKNNVCYQLYANNLQNTENGTTYGYLLIWADINGHKGPNRMGRDVFQFQVLQNSKRIIPTNIDVSKRSSLLPGCTKDKSNAFHSGSSCGALIIKDGWKISDDYPW